jgi:hypothetical protein
MKKKKLCLGLVLMAMAPSSQAFIYSDWSHLLLESVEEIVVTAPRMTDEGGFDQYNMLMHMTRWLDHELALVGISPDFMLAHQHQVMVSEAFCTQAVAEWRSACKVAVAGAETGCATGAILLGGRILGALGYLSCTTLSSGAGQRCDTFEKPVEGCD